MLDDIRIKRKVLSGDDDFELEDSETIAQLYLHLSTALGFTYEMVMSQCDPEPGCEVTLAVGTMVNHMRKQQGKIYAILKRRGDLPPEYEGIENRFRTTIDPILVETGSKNDIPTINPKKENFH